MYIICIYICIYIYMYIDICILYVYIYIHMFTFWLFEVVNWKITISPVPFGFPTMPPNLPKLLAVVSHPEKSISRFFQERPLLYPGWYIYIYVIFWVRSAMWHVCISRAPMKMCLNVPHVDHFCWWDEPRDTGSTTRWKTSDVKCEDWCGWNKIHPRSCAIEQYFKHLLSCAIFVFWLMSIQTMTPLKCEGWNWRWPCW